MKAKPSPRTTFQDLCALSLFNCGYPLSPNHGLRAGGSGAGPLVSAGLSMSSLCWLDGFHVSSHNLFMCCTATLPHHILVMSTKWRGSPKRHHTGLRGVETWGSQYTYIPHSAFNCPFIVPPAVFTVRMHVDAQPLFPPHPCGRY